MTFFKLLSVVCGFLLFASAFGTPWTQVDVGCYDFIGTVKCRDNASILKSAVVELWEDDLLPFGDDLLHTTHLQPAMDQKSATFSWHGCYDDGKVYIQPPSIIFPTGPSSYPIRTMELYYVFKDVCSPGDSYHARDVLQEQTTYILHLNEANLA